MKTKFKAKPAQITELAKTNKLFVCIKSKWCIQKNGNYISGCYLVHSVTTVRVNRIRTFTLHIDGYGKVVLTAKEWNCIWFTYEFIKEKQQVKIKTTRRRYGRKGIYL